MGAINSKNMYIDGTHAIFPAARDIQVADFQPRDNKYTRGLHIPTLPCIFVCLALFWREVCSQSLCTQ